MAINLEVVMLGHFHVDSERGNGKIEAILDWKSDVEVLPDRVAHYLDQLRTYRDETGAEQALLVFMTSSKVMYA